MSNTEASFERGLELSYLDAGQTYPRPRPTSHMANRTASPWPQRPPKPGRGSPAGAQPYVRHPNPGFPIVDLVLSRRRCTLEGVAASQVHGLGNSTGRISGPAASWPGTDGSSRTHTRHLPEPLPLAGRISQCQCVRSCRPVRPRWAPEGC